MTRTIVHAIQTSNLIQFSPRTYECYDQNAKETKKSSKFKLNKYDSPILSCTVQTTYCTPAKRCANIMKEKALLPKVGPFL